MRDIMRNSARITPACAGIRDWIADPIRCSKDHPRVRGDKMALVKC